MKAAYSDWEIQGGEDIADELQQEIEGLTSQVRDTQDEKLGFDLSKKADVLCLKRDAFQSGKTVLLETFVRTVIDYKGRPIFSEAEIASAIRSLIDDMKHNYFFEGLDVEVIEVVLGADQLNEFTRILKEIFRTRAHQYAEEKWDELRPFLMAKSYKEHPLFAGNET